MAGEELEHTAPYTSVRAQTPRGDIDMRLYEARDAEAGVVVVGGVGGGYDSPARGLYPRLGEELPASGLSVLRVQFRKATNLGDAIYDVFAGTEVLRRRGAGRIGLVGHSFGGAVVLNAALLSPSVRTVVTIATQSHGADLVARLAPRSLLLLHGARDEVLPSACSESVYARAQHPKELEIFPQAGHALDEVAREVHARVREWLLHELGADAAGAAPS